MVSEDRLAGMMSNEQNNYMDEYYANIHQKQKNSLIFYGIIAAVVVLVIIVKK